MSIQEMIPLCRSALHDKQWDAKQNKDVNVGVWHSIIRPDGSIQAIKCPLIANDKKDQK